MVRILGVGKGWSKKVERGEVARGICLVGFSELGGSLKDMQEGFVGGGR